MGKLYVPNDILRVFKNLYPEIDAQDVKWKWEVPGKIYQAEFILSDQCFEVEITVTGHHLLTETSIKHAIPDAVRTTVSRFFADRTILSATLILYSNDLIAYEVVLDDDCQVLVREDGLLLLEDTDL